MKTERDNFEVKLFDAFWEQAKAWLIETGQYDDFIAWQKVYGVGAKSKVSGEL